MATAAVFYDEIGQHREGRLPNRNGKSAGMGGRDDLPVIDPFKTGVGSIGCGREFYQQWVAGFAIVGLYESVDAGAEITLYGLVCSHLYALHKFSLRRFGRLLRNIYFREVL